MQAKKIQENLSYWRIMKTTAIICEYNPLTNGHVKHLQQARSETGCDTLLCVMSGSFTQRGDAAITDKYLRAEQAIIHGADIVIELPTIFAISPADNFAYGAIKTISQFPSLQYLSFGSESGDLNGLLKLAKLLGDEPKEYKEILQGFLKKGFSFPKSRALALSEYSIISPEYKDLVGFLDYPNNVLGIAYIIAAKKANLKIKFHTVKRIGSSYNSDCLEETYSSASAIRTALQEGKMEEIKSQVPESTYEMLKTYKPRDNALGSMMLFKLKTMSGYDLEKYYDVSGGIHNRLIISATNAITLEELLTTAKTKNYTMARLKRICLYALFDITQEDYSYALSCPPYIQILAIKENRKEDILPELFKSCKNVLTRYSDVSKVDKALRPLIRLDFAAQGTLSIANKVNYLNKKMLIVSID